MMSIRYAAEALSSDSIQSTLFFIFLKKTLGSGGSFSGFAFFLPPKEDFFSFDEDSPF
jgi:hypothetical protein